MNAPIAVNNTEPIFIEESVSILDYEIFHRTTIPDNSSTTTIEKRKPSSRIKNEAMKKLLNFNRVTLLLHGGKFTSQTWEDTGILRDIAMKTGIPAIAIDFPGFGKSKVKQKSEHSHGVVMPPEKAVEFLEQVPVLLGFPHAKIIIIAPSSSGVPAFSWALETSHEIEAMIPVAPIGLDRLPSGALQSIKLPILHLYGSLDDHGMKTSKILYDSMSDFRAIEMPNAGHNCYLDHTELFNEEVTNFIEYLVLRARHKYHLAHEHQGW